MQQIRVRYFALFFIIALGFFLRFYNLDKFPVQLNHDEVSQIYDVISIVETGKDIYGNFMPVAFPSTGEYKVGHYIYISIIPYLIFGNHEEVIRYSSAFFGALTIPVVFLFIFQVMRNHSMALLCAFFVAINPSDIFYSRKSFENVIGVFFAFLGLYLLMKLLEKNSKFLLFLTPVILTFPMYLYTAHTLAIPLILVIFFILFRKKFINIKKTVVIFISIWLITILPLIYLILFNPGIRFRALSVSIFQDINLQKQISYIQTEDKIRTLVYENITTVIFLFNKYLKQFTPGYLFSYGLDMTNQSILGHGPLFAFELPLFLIGAFFLIRKIREKNEVKFIFFILLIVFIPSAITFEDYSPHRSIMGFTVISIISGIGLWFLAHNLFVIRKFSYESTRDLTVGVSSLDRTSSGFGKPATLQSGFYRDKLKILLLFFAGVIILINFLYFINIYTINFAYEKSQQMHYPFKQISLFAWSQHGNFDKIIIDPNYGQSWPVRAVAVHYYLAYYGNYPPERFQKEYNLNKQGLYFDKFEIRKVDWSIDRKIKNALIISSPWDLPINSINKEYVIKKFDFYDKSPAYYAVKTYE